MRRQRKPLAEGEIEPTLQRLVPRFLAGNHRKSLETILDEARQNIYRWKGKQRAKAGNGIEGVPYGVVHEAAKKAAAKYQRTQTTTSTSIYEHRQSLKKIAQRDPRLLRVANALSQRHAIIASGLAAGQTLSDIAESNELESVNLGTYNAALALHYKHYLRTGELPRKGNPTVRSRRLATDLIEEHFPNLDRSERSKFILATALGLDNRIPVHSDDIYRLKAVLKKEPGSFQRKLLKRLDPS